MRDLREAAEMALEALEHAAECVQTNYLPDKCGHDWDEQIEALRQALAQPEQRGHCTCGEPEALGVVHFRTRPCFHYIHQPKREWVGLTDEEMKKTWYEMQNIMGWYSFQEISQAVEAKLKEKNSVL